MEEVNVWKLQFSWKYDQDIVFMMAQLIVKCVFQVHIAEYLIYYFISSCLVSP